MIGRWFKTRSVQNDGLWRVLLLLLVAVVVPTVCVLWFMTEAMRSQRLAVRQELTTVYHNQLLALEQELQAFWEDKQAALASVDPDIRAAEVFARLVRAGVADSVIVYGDSGQLIYPPGTEPTTTAEAADSTAWLRARGLEFNDLEYPDAARVYGAIAKGTPDINLAARALQAQARCFNKAGRKEAAVRVLTETLAQARFRSTVDVQGRLIVPNAQLMALHLMSDPTLDTFQRTADRLRARLSDYSDPALTVAQRRFLMRQLQGLMPQAPAFPTLEAEDLAVRYLESNPAPQQGAWLRPSGLPDIWQVTSPNRRLVALYREQVLIAEMGSLLATRSMPAGATVELLPPGARQSRQTSFMSLSAGGFLPGWLLALRLPDQNFLDTAADEQIAAYLWTGVLVVAFILILALVIARSLGRQMRLTRLKNTLIATVSHELKTPLASMRLLVDTLLDDQGHDERKVREYLQLMSKENARLSRLIEHFLTFSRMERNKQAFTPEKVQPAEIVATAAEAVQERFSASGCRFDVDVAQDLPAVMADPDALATAVINLLDNAHKYSKDEGHIVLRAYAQNQHLCFEVQDNGIGLSRRATKKVFDRFYQVDQRLSRSGSGVGLGLSIVKFIVDGHGGQMTVTSQLGQGSTFTVKLPAAGRRS